MAVQNSSGYALNRTRGAYLASDLLWATTHWSRLRGLMFTGPAEFRTHRGLWISPSHGIHTFCMRFPIDVVYLDKDCQVIYTRSNLKPWRIAPVHLRAASVLELPENTLQPSGTSVGDQIDIVLGKRPEALPK